jgi:hypothetical protein
VRGQTFEFLSGESGQKTVLLWAIGK